MSEGDDPQRRVRQLLLSGDNMLKNRHDQEAADRARTRFEEARRVAREAGLPESLREIIDRRLEALDQRAGADAA
jgi:hypothetical protein